MKSKEQKRTYTKPVIESVKLDKEISILMMSPSPPGDPEIINNTGSFNLNPFKFPKL